MTRRILHVVTNISHYADPDEPTGLWLSELDDLSGGPGRTRTCNQAVMSRRL